MNIKRVYLTAHPSPTHTHMHTLYIQTRMSGLNLSYEQTNIADTQTFLVWLKGICVLWMCSSR